jgi:hypothetical protein
MVGPVVDAVIDERKLAEAVARSAAATSTTASTSTPSTTGVSPTTSGGG